jgi:hypothetical protein
MRYRLKLWLLKKPKGSLAWRRARGTWHRLTGRGPDVGEYGRIPRYIRDHVAGRTFLDVGCMWGVNGEYMFVAEDAGATQVTGIDVFGPTPEFEARRSERDSPAEFVLGDAVDPETIARAGQADVVLCAGVLYHHPSPFDVLVALRRMCRDTLILRTSTIPEVPGLPHAAVYWPAMSAAERRVWELRSLGVGRQTGITGAFEPEAGYGNWFWGLSPSCVAALLDSAGFEVLERATEAFAQTFVCRAVTPPLAHRLPGEREARELGEAISVAGIARPQ